MSVLYCASTQEKVVIGDFYFLFRKTKVKDLTIQFEDISCFSPQKSSAGIPRDTTPIFRESHLKILGCMVFYGSMQSNGGFAVLLWKHQYMQHCTKILYTCTSGLDMILQSNPSTRPEYGWKFPPADTQKETGWPKKQLFGKVTTRQAQLILSCSNFHWYLVTFNQASLLAGRVWSSPYYGVEPAKLAEADVWARHVVDPHNLWVLETGPLVCQEDDLRNVIVHRRHPQHPFSRVFARH